MKIKLSILIPIYNACNYLEETLQSIVKQKDYENIPLEVLMIDDGSTDNSADICREYQKKYKNFKYYYKNNSGVSMTRNYGMKIAKGDYILFLDSDDTIQENTLKSVLYTFDKYAGEANILAYPLFNMTNESVIPHERQSVYEKEGVYNIEITPYINQCTMNVVIKNLPENEKIWFNTQLKQSEDALFNTQMILSTNKIIIASSGGYNYRKDLYSTVDRFKNPVDIKNMLLDFFEALASLANKDGKLKTYVQSMVLYEINWRFVQNVFYPNHLNNDDFNKWVLRLQKIFDFIDAETIIKQPFMDYYHKCYFIENFKKDIVVNVDSSGAIVKVDDKQITKISKFTLVFNKIKFHETNILFEGYIKGPFKKIMNNVTFEIEDNNNNIRTIDLIDTQANYYKAKVRTANFKGFSFELSLENINKYEFNVKLNGLLQNTTSYFENSVIFKKYLNSSIVVKGQYIISYSNNPFIIHIDEKKSLTENNRNFLLKQKRNLNLPANRNMKHVIKLNEFLKFVLKSKEIWLYNDRENIKDNAFYQFVNDMTINDGILRYYVVYGKKSDKLNIPLKQQVVYGSVKHKMLFINSKMIITSFKDFTEYSPISRRLFNTLYSDLNFNLVYLQHGILHAHTPWLYSKFKTNFDYYLISSELEKNNLIENYGYNQSDLIEAGMPRFDIIAGDVSKKKKKILYAPSWRKSFVDEKNNKARTLNLPALENSLFYKAVVSLINNKDLIDLLKNNNYVLDIKLHPILLENKQIFSSKYPEIKILNSDDMIKESDYSLFVTDFSSYVFDYIKLNTPVTFLFPDKKHFQSGNHIYNTLDFNLSIFGPEFIEIEDFIEFISKGIGNDFKQNNLYKSNELFFDLKGNKATTIVYDKLRNFK